MHRNRWRLPIVLIALLLTAAGFMFLKPGILFSRSPLKPPPGLIDASGPTAQERYLWRPVAIGGGGFVTGIGFDATGATMVTRSDVFGAYLWDGARDRWEQLLRADALPSEARVQHQFAAGAYEVAVAPGRPRRIYLAVAGQVLRSDDRGAHFTLPSAAAGKGFEWDANSEFRFAGPFLAVDPADPDIVYLGTPAQGLWRSTDGGGDWARIDTVPPSLDAHKEMPGGQFPGIPVWFVPGGGGRVYAASPGNGLYASGPSGTDFARVGPGSGPLTVDRGAFGSGGDFLAIDSAARKLWRLRGGAWTEISGRSGLDWAGFVGLAADEGGRRILVSDAGGEIWCSADRGDNWQHLNRSQGAGAGDPPWLGLNNHSYFAAAQMLFDPKVKGRLWVAAGVGPYFADIGAGRCPDSVNWKSRARGIEELVAEDVIQPPGHAPLFAAIDFGIHVKPDLNRFSTTYGPKPRPLIAAQDMDWSPSNPSFVVTNASDTRRNCCSEDGDAILAGYSMDGGQSWSKFADLPTPPGTKPDDPWRMAYGTIAVAADTIDNIVWVPAFDRAPFFTRDRGRTWQRVIFPGETLPLTGSFANEWLPRRTLAADRVLPGTFYLVHSGTTTNPGLAGLWRTTDGGGNWRRMFTGEISPASASAAKLRAVPGKAGHLFFTSDAGGGDSRLQRTTDGGAHWKAFDDVDLVDDIGFGKAARGAHYPTIFLSGRVRGAYGIWRSVDAGSTWQRVAGFPLSRLDRVNVIEGDKDVFGRVYVGYVGSGWLYGEPARCRPAPVAISSAAECFGVAPAAGTAGGR